MTPKTVAAQKRLAQGATDLGYAMNCMLCASPMTRHVECYDWQRPDDSSKYLMLWCEACQFGCLSGEFLPERIRTFYDVSGGYYTHAKTDQQAPRQRLSQRLVQHLAWRVDHGVDFRVSELGPANGRTLCDIGCGDGALLTAATGAGFDVTGIEPDEKAASRSLGLRVVTGSAENIPRNVGTFDVVTMFHSLEHCAKPDLAIENAKRLLRPNGLLVIEVPNSQCYGIRSFGIVGAWCDIPRHLYFFSRRSLTALIEKSGLAVEGCNYRGYFGQFTPAWTRAQYQLWRRHSDRKSPDFDRRLFWLLARTALASSDAKYDSIRLYARRC